jgi:hypothetical protein
VLEVRRLLCNFTLSFAGVAELADALDSKFSNERFYPINSDQMRFAFFAGKIGG